MRRRREHYKQHTVDFCRYSQATLFCIDYLGSGKRIGSIQCKLLLGTLHSEHLFSGTVHWQPNIRQIYKLSILFLKVVCIPKNQQQDCLCRQNNLVCWGKHSLEFNISHSIEQILYFHHRLGIFLD